MKQLQNRIAEGGATLPVAALLTAVVWLFRGLVGHGLWPQLACLVASVYLLVELSNQNALLRVRSRMVSSTFLVLHCTACFLLPSLSGALVQLCFIIAFIILFHTYQNSQAVGHVYYAFLAIGVASMAFVQTLFFVPLLWVLMATQLQALSWRSWLASLIGLLTPYWFAVLWLLWQQDFSPLAAHFALLADVSPQLPATGAALGGRVLALVFTVVMAAVGVVHFRHYSYEDKIFIRLLYGFFTATTLFTVLLMLVQPQHADVLMRVLFVVASPLIAHVLTLTSSRLSNISFFVAIAVALAITTVNLLIS